MHAQDDTPPQAAYDFHPAASVIFADDFASAPVGEFPPKWKISSGQAVIAKVGGRTAFSFIGTDSGHVEPRIKQSNYLPSAFTVEFDLNLKESTYPLELHLAKDADYSSVVSFSAGAVSFATADNSSTNASYPEAQAEENFANRWHHVELAYTAPQLKVYVDKARMLYIPDIGMAPVSLFFNITPTNEMPESIANFRLASGSGANVVASQTTDAHIVTHDINFATGSAEITLASGAEINRIAGILSGNSSHYEIAGHTDNTGTPAKNMTLSQQRAESVKAALVSAGIDASRLTTKGYGDTKPLSPNTTPEGKANNRRVELNRLD